MARNLTDLPIWAQDLIEQQRRKITGLEQRLARIRRHCPHNDRAILVIDNTPIRECGTCGQRELLYPDRPQYADYSEMM